MSSVIQNMKEAANEIASLLSDLIKKHSDIYKWNTGNTGFSIISTSGDYSYKDLGTEGLQLQSRVMDLYKRHYSIIFTMLSNEPSKTVQELEKYNKSILEIINQNNTWSSSVSEESQKVFDLIKNQVKLLERLHDTSSSSFIFVPDTNALIYNPSIETWGFDKIKKFEIVLLATVLSELDSLKINHRNEGVREKAKKLIQKIKEYRRRGVLTEGVTIVKDRIFLRAIALEPKMEQSLPWFDPENNDDRFLAATIEVLREHLNSQVMLVTGDINLQNKAEFSRIPFSEPPKP